MLKKWRGEKEKKKSLKWGGILLALIMSLSTTVGFLGVKSTKALPVDYDWSVTSESGLTLTVVSVQQNGVELAPVWSDHIYNYDIWSFGNYYFPVTNSADKLRIGMLVDGMADDEVYKVGEDEHELTSADNGTVVFEEIKPRVYGYSMKDSAVCRMNQGEEECEYDPLANEYVISADIRKSNWSDRISKELVVRPEHVGSQLIEIMSVQQGGEDLFLDTMGWNVTTWEEMRNTLQTINEYRIDDYTTSIEVTYKLKNLEIGKTYSVSVGNDAYYSFKADATERIDSQVLTLDYTKKHVYVTINVNISGDYYNDNSVNLYFRVADTNFRELGNIIIDEIRQGETPLPSESDVSSWMREYTFRANDVQPLGIALHAINATPEMTYYLSYSMYGNNAYIYSREPIAVTGEELFLGTVLTIPSGYGLEENSPMTLNLSVNTVGTTMSYGSVMTYYQDPGPTTYNSDTIMINYYEDDELPRFGASIGYTNSDEEVYDVINAKYHDAEHPLWVRVEGERYDDATNYEVHAKVGIGNGNIYDETFMATGAELNAGKTFVLDGLVLSLPTFDPNGSSSGYEMSYDFSLEINGLEQRGTLVYMHNGYLYAMMTYAGGKVSASGGGGGMGGAMFMTSSTITVRRTSLDGSKNAVLHYRGGGFDEDLSYNYAIYYNGNAGDAWWSAPAGTKIEEGVLTGQYLNNNGLSVNVVVPDNASESSMYSLVITRNGGLVIVSKDFLRFTDAPMIESFAFHADNDSFMQTGSMSYRLAREAEATATLTGAGFDDAEEYKLWVSYRGYKGVEDEYGNYHSEDVDLSSLDEAIVMTGEQLNAGYNYVLGYDAVFDEAETIEVMFDVTDKDGEKPDPYYGTTEGSYNGHVIYIDYVYEEDVFRADDGFQIDTETGEIIDVAQPDDHHGGDEMIDNRTVGRAEASVEDGTLTLTAEKPCVVIGVNGDDLTVVEAGAGSIQDNVTTNLYDVSGYERVVVALKGDGDFDGTVSSGDSNLINRSLISHSLRPYRGLSDLEKKVFDVDGDGVVTSGDSNLINRSLISPSLRPYKALEW